MQPDEISLEAANLELSFLQDERNTILHELGKLEAAGSAIHPVYPLAIRALKAEIEKLDKLVAQWKQTTVKIPAGAKMWRVTWPKEREGESEDAQQ